MGHSTITTRLVAASLGERMSIICTQLDAVFANLNDAQPGYPSSVLGASVDAGPSSEPDGLNPVERLATVADAARRDLDRLHELIDKLRTPVDELHALTVRWSYSKHTPPTIDDDVHEWCTSCLRTQTFEPVSRGVGTGDERLRLCWFCADMLTVYGHLPSLALLDKRSRGRVSRADREADVARFKPRPKRRRVSA